MKVKTSELQGAALDWAVAKAGGCSEQRLLNVEMWRHIRHQGAFRYSTDWAQGGAIIYQLLAEGADIRQGGPKSGNQGCWMKLDSQSLYSHGPNLLVAGMRCYVTAKLGEEVEVPFEIMNLEPDNEVGKKPKP